MNQPNPLAVSIAEAVKMCGCGRTSIYYAVKRNELSVKKRGRRTWITVEALKAHIAGLLDGGSRNAA